MKLARRATRSTGPGLTALIDAVFILLLFFLLTARLTPATGVPLEMAATPDNATITPDPVSAAPALLEITPTELRLGGRSVSPEQISERISGSQGQDIVLQPEGDVRLQRLLTVREQLLRAGIAAGSIRTALPLPTS